MQLNFMINKFDISKNFCYTSNRLREKGEINMVNYSDIKFPIQKEEDKYTVIDFGGQKIKVLKYLPSLEKYNLLNTTLIQSFDDTVAVNDFKISIFLTTNMAIAYSDIIFSEEEKNMELTDLYDKLYQSGLLDAIIKAIPNDEKMLLTNLIKELEKTYLDDKRSILYGLDNLFKQLKDVIPSQEEMQKIIDQTKNFKPEDFQRVIDFATAANGGREINE